MASLKQLDERRYKITVSNGYRPDGRKVCKARTLHVPKRIPRRSVLQYVMHAAEELEKEFKYGYAEDGEKTFEAYARGWLERQTHYAPSTLAGYRQMLERVYGEIGQIRLKELRPITIEYLLEKLRKQPGPSGRKLGEATVQKYWGVVSVVLNDAKRNQIIAYNPAQCIGKPEAKYREQKIPTDKEAKRFLGLLEQAPRTVRAAVEGYPAGMHRSVAEQGACSGSGSAGGPDKEWKAKAHSGQQDDVRSAGCIEAVAFGNAGRDHRGCAAVCQ